MDGAAADEDRRHGCSDEHPMKTLNVRLPDDLYEALRLAAFEQRKSMNALVVAALRKS